MDQTLVLNGRQYRLCDIGEGKCRVIITYEPELDSLENAYQNLCDFSQRLIVVDISLSVSHTIKALTHREARLLVKDISLLLDIFWLDDVCIEIEGVSEPFSELLSSLLAVHCVNEVL